MALSEGTTIGPYEVIGLIGQGGMGEVWQARDTKLDRDVALKVLPEAFTSDPDRLARFEREAKVLASLNHPNIGSIYGLEEAEDVRALVLELVEGPTLADRIKQGSIPLDEALPIAKQIAEALEAAHEQGVIHRDLKPANIKVKDDGTVKVLDFGLAKAFQPDAGDPGMSQSPTISLTAAATQMGMVIGTAAYMSPEQAKGKVVDKRADVWAFGAVVYEMLTGRRAFTGDDLSDTLAAVLRAEVTLDELPDETPPRLRQALTACLQRDPKQRVHDMADVRLAMEGAFETTESAPSEPVSVPELQVWQRPVPAAIIALLIATTVGVGLWTAMRPAPRPVARMMLTVPPGEPLYLNFPNTDVAISPDGTHVVYAGTLDGQTQLYVRALDELDPTVLTGLGSQPRNPFISPDGNWVGFFDTGALQRVSIRGGPPVPIADVYAPPRGASWGADDTIIYATANAATGLWQVASGGGEPELLTTPDTERGEQDHFWPEILPGGRAVLFTIMPQGPVENRQIAVLSLESRTYEVVLPGGSQARYVPTGHLVYGVRGTLQAVGFDLDRLEVTTDPVPVVDTVNMKGTGAANFGVAKNHSLVYVRGGGRSATGLSLVWVDREGNEEPLAAPPDNYSSLRISPDGSRVAMRVVDDSGNSDIHIYDIARNNLTQLTFTAEFECCPVWMPDGERLVFTSNRSGTTYLDIKNADGTGEAEPLTEGAEAMFPRAITKDGAMMVFESQGDLHTLSLDGERTVTALVETESTEGRPRLSPDGQWIAYQTDESGGLEVLVRTFPEIDGGRWEATTDGGHSPVWSPNGRELFYYANGTMWAVPVETEPTFRPLNPEALFQGAYVVQPGNTFWPFDIAPNGERFLMRKPGVATLADDDIEPQLVVVQNWTQELLERVPVN